MARGRMLAQSLSTSCKFAALHDQAGALAEFCQMLFMLAVAHADDCGRLQGDAWTVKQRVVPASPRSLTDVDQALDALERVGLVRRYQVDGHVVLAIVRFQTHQELRHVPRSALPPPPGTTDPSPPRIDGAGSTRGNKLAGTGQFAPKEGSKEGSKEGRKSRARARAFVSSATYLEACPHDPPCETPHLCGRRRELAAAVRRGDLTAAQGARLEHLWLLDRHMVQATPRRAKKAAAS